MDTEIRVLKCVLTDPEKRALRALAASLTAAVDRAARALRESMIDSQLSQAGQGWVLRDVECVWEVDWAAQVKRCIRQDTGEIVDEVPLPRQQTPALNGEHE
jgi:hypothetical protein